MERNRLSRLPLQWIRSFETAGRLGSFTAAAQELNLSQAAVSQQIQALEHALGAKIFTRKSRSVELTVDGEAWLPDLQLALNTITESAEALFAMGRHRLTLSVPYSISRFWLPQFVAPLRREGFSHLEIKSYLTRASDAEASDLSIRYGYARSNHYAHPLFSERLAPVASATLLAQHSEWRDAPAISITGPRKGWHEWALSSGESLPSQLQIKCDSMATAIDLALTGAGVALASLPLVAQFLKDGSLKQVHDGVLCTNDQFWLLGDQARLSLRQWEKISALLAANQV
ncbi:MAG: LysR family transcriptional regulator [Gammaproteobacteria bacterium]|nr:LysR family transcriptional regulator [Gammaproteobacteria bacterium]